MNVKKLFNRMGYTGQYGKLGSILEGLVNDNTDKNLLTLNIKGTTQSITFNHDDSVHKIQHKTGEIITREDVFTYTENLITEVRTLDTSETITFKYHLDTLETEVI